MNRNWELNMKNDPRQSCNLEGFLFCFHPCATCGTFLHILPSSTSLVKFKLVHFLHFCLVHEIYVKEQAPHFACLLLHLGFCWFWTVWIFWTSIQNLKRKTLCVCFFMCVYIKIEPSIWSPKNYNLGTQGPLEFFVYSNLLFCFQISFSVSFQTQNPLQSSFSSVMPSILS